MSHPIDRRPCEACGSTYFGSSNIRGPGEMTRSCHGTTASGRYCAVTWKQSEDWRYFLIDGKAYSDVRSYKIAHDAVLLRESKNVQRAVDKLERDKAKKKLETN